MIELGVTQIIMTLLEAFQLRKLTAALGVTQHSI